MGTSEPTGRPSGMLGGDEPGPSAEIAGKGNNPDDEAGQNPAGSSDVQESAAEFAALSTKVG